MTNFQFDPTYLQQDDDGADSLPPTQADLSNRWIEGDYSFEKYLEALSVFFPQQAIVIYQDGAA